LVGFIADFLINSIKYVVVRGGASESIYSIGGRM
jgi:hypothetical protein